MINLVTPYLIQRCEIVRPLLKEGRFSQVVKTDYMGSSEFEWGALPKSLRTLQAHVDGIKLTVDPRIKNAEDCSLRILHALTEEQYATYFEHLVKLRAGEIHTKEATRFEADRQPMRYSVTDLWWDIDNHTMFSFDKIFMNRLGEALVESWRYMDEQKDR